jgi:hypothetical protein
MAAIKTRRVKTLGFNHPNDFLYRLGNLLGIVVTENVNPSKIKAPGALMILMIVEILNPSAIGMATIIDTKIKENEGIPFLLILAKTFGKIPSFAPAHIILGSTIKLALMVEVIASKAPNKIKETYMGGDMNI